MITDAELSTRAHAAVRSTLKAGARAYIKHESVRRSVSGLLRINGLDRVTELRTALRNAQALYAAGHWSGNLNRIIGLKQALMGEIWMRRDGRKS